MEAALAAEDPRLVSTLSAKTRSPRSLTLFRGVILSLVGMVALLIGLVAKIPLISIAGFLIALFGIFGAISNSSNRGAKAKSSGKSSGNGKGKFSDRLQRRWDERN